MKNLLNQNKTNDPLLIEEIKSGVSIASDVAPLSDSDVLRINQAIFESTVNAIHEFNASQSSNGLEAVLHSGGKVVICEKQEAHLVKSKISEVELVKDNDVDFEVIQIYKSENLADKPEASTIYALTFAACFSNLRDKWNGQFFPIITVMVLVSTVLVVLSVTKK
ncbi:hypothetical protein [Vibrio parahaemolyticus]|uniref:hypothetical protein n=1 Tax=Vibrio parahaemolyticus TaxID=670 RepID=UPI0004DF9D80|nr:hypothetical protein [Vibrio parahaemolyticus]